MTADGYSKELEQRLANCVSARLGVPVTFCRWDTEPTGATRPVFNVPEHARQRAREWLTNSSIA